MMTRNEALLVGGAGVIAFIVPLLLLWPNRQPAVAEPEPAKPTKLVIIPTVPPTDFLAKPLFNAERSPAAAVEVAVDSGEQAPPPSPPPQLVGAVVRGRYVGVALVRDAAGETVMLNLGDAVDGWRLLSVSADRAVFDQAGRRETVKLDFSNKKSADEPADPSTTAPSPIAMQPSDSAVLSNRPAGP